MFFSDAPKARRNARVDVEQSVFVVALVVVGVRTSGASVGRGRSVDIA